MKKQHVSLKDVAKKAGVSFQTASKALNNTGSIAPATRARILAAAKELGYVRNTLARGLVMQNSSLIGVVASDMSQTILAQPIVGIEREARALGFDVIIGSVSRSGDNRDSVVRTLLERRVDGILLVAPRLEYDDGLTAMLPDGLPVVSTHIVAGKRVPIVRTHELQIGQEAARHLLSLGHHRVATIIGDHTRNVSQIRLEGFQQVLADGGEALDPALIEEAGWDVNAAYQATHRLLDAAAPPTAIFAQNDTMAIGALAAIYDRGLRVPDDCAVIGCDDLPVAARTIPPLTTFHIAFEEVGRTAMRMLASHIAGQADDTGDTAEQYISAPLIYRASTGLRVDREPQEAPAATVS